MLRNLVRTRRRKVAAAVVATLTVASVAAAAWIVTSNGTGQGRTGNLVAPQFQAVQNANSDFLFPEGTSDLTVRVNNTNSYAVVLTGVQQNGAVSTPDSPSCGPGGHITVPTQTGLSISVPAGISEFDIPDALAMSAAAPTSCMNTLIQAPITGSWSTPTS